MFGPFNTTLSPLWGFPFLRGLWTPELELASLDCCPSPASRSLPGLREVLCLAAPTFLKSEVRRVILPSS